jgi:hypothetical protein
MDRKAWIILTICGILLALNFYYKPEPPQPAPVTTQPENGGQSSTANDNKSKPSPLKTRMVRTLLNLLSHRVVVVSKLPPY